MFITGYFELLTSKDCSFRTYQELDATLVETPFTGNSGLFILRDEEGNEYSLKPVYRLNWERQLNGLQLGKAYHFAFIFDGISVLGMKILDVDSLIYLALSYSDRRGGLLEPIEEQFGFLEGFKARQLDESIYDPKKRVSGTGDVSLITVLPMVFEHSEQVAKLYYGQEATFTIPQGEFLVHVLRSDFVDPQNYYDGGHYYSFYIKRL